jgi:hypothetical protein
MPDNAKLAATLLLVTEERSVGRLAHRRAYPHERQLGDTGPMTMQVPSPPARLATLCLLVALTGSVGLVAGEVVSALWLLTLLGAVGCLAGVTGLGILVYRVSRQTGTGILRSLGRTLSAAIQLIFDLLP